MQTTTRAEQLRQWVRAATEHDLLEHEDEVMWGATFNLEDTSTAPVAFFATEEEAKAYTVLSGRPEWHIGPYVLQIRGRDDFDVPVASSATSTKETP